MTYRYPTEASDGTAHLAYYAGGVSFVWSGNGEHPIQVCPGGYGDQVADVIQVRWRDDDPLAGSPPLHIALREFRRTCDQWLLGHGIDPTS